MNKKYIHSIEYISPIIKDDYGNDLWLALVNMQKSCGDTGYYVMSKNGDFSDGYVTYATEAFWKTKEKDLLLIDTKEFRVEEYAERMHSLEWKPKAETGYQSAPKEDLNLVTRFHVIKNIQK